MAAKVVKGRCALCDKPATMVCGRCRTMPYCARDCQSKHWSRHRQECAPPREPEVPLCGDGYRTWYVANPIPSPTTSSSSNSSVVRVGVGFDNHGNSCYLNAVLQSLCHTPLLRHGLLQACKATKDEWLLEVSALFRQFDQASRGSSSSSSSIYPEKLLRRMYNSHQEFAGGGQADAHEALMFLFEMLLKGCLSSGDGKGNDLRKLNYEETERHERVSLIGHVFGFDLGACTQCKSCRYESLNGPRVNYCLQLNASMGLSDRDLDQVKQDGTRVLHAFRSGHRPGQTVEAAPPTTLEDLLLLYQTPEFMEDWECEKCKKKGGHRSECIIRLPNVLAVYIDRQPHVAMFSKINRAVKTPLTLDLADIVSSETEGPTKYRLYAIVVHLDIMRSTFFGHYVAYVRDSEDEWFLCDDSNVRQVPWSHVREQLPYLLFYQREQVLPPESGAPRKLFAAALPPSARLKASCSSSDDGAVSASPAPPAEGMGQPSIIPARASPGDAALSMSAGETEAGRPAGGVDSDSDSSSCDGPFLHHKPRGAANGHDRDVNYYEELD